MPSLDPASFVQDNTAYETWLAAQCRVVHEDLRYKHERMALDAFTFLRATYFRWARQIEHVCPDLKSAPLRLCVGDVHVENFGTWRDAEGRLVWGVNDFDEAEVMPYAFDLVRLAASARLAPQLRMRGRDIAASILEGYRKGLEAPRPTLLDEQETWMRPYVVCSDQARGRFWKHVFAHPPVEPLPSVQEGLIRSLPRGAEIRRFSMAYRKGAGSLGRPRYLAIAAYAGGHVVREAKALVPSAWSWACGLAQTKSFVIELAHGTHRAPDPFLAVEDGFVFRRIAADSRKVELGDEGVGLAPDVLRAMGFDLASIHAADRTGEASIAFDLQARGPDWLREASREAAASVIRDYQAWLDQGLASP